MNTNNPLSEKETFIARIKQLESENRLLKSLLDQAGIAYPSGDTAIAGSAAENVPLVPITVSLARKFYSYFWGRTDVFAKRAMNRKTGKSGYYLQCDHFWQHGICPKASGQKQKCGECPNRSWTKLEARHIVSHLQGEKADASDVIGVYPLFPDGTCRFLVFDFDEHNAESENDKPITDSPNLREEVDALREICRLHEIPCPTERSRSGNGAHVWIFFSEPLDASLARRFGFALLDKGAESVNLKSFRTYDRLLPAQDSLADGELGNLIALPLQGLALQNGNSAFVDEKWNAFPDQWKVLFDTEKLSKQDLESKISAWQGHDPASGPSSYAPKPWEKTMRFQREDCDGMLRIVRANLVFVETANLKPRLQNQIRRLAAFSNPVFFRNRAIGLSNYSNGRFIYLGEDDSGFIGIPRGLYETLADKCRGAGIPFTVEDRRADGKQINVTFTGVLRDNQREAAETMMKADCGILNAATAFGKTVVCCGLISELKTSTLILLESSSLISQWEKAISNFLNLDESLPEYTTKSGRIKTRSSFVGIIQGPKDSSTGIIDIAMVGSLCKKGEFHPRLKEYGLVLVDECHHSASETMREVLREIHAKHLYGVTATPFRSDGLEKINEMLLGPVRYRYTARKRAEEMGINCFVLPRFTRVVFPGGDGEKNIGKAYECLRNSEVRNEQIVSDIRDCIALGRTPVVLTKYVKHAKLLADSTRGLADHVFLLTSEQSSDERENLCEEMEQVAPSESLILVATGQLIGEGFDYPRLDTLIMAMPVAWKGIVEQYAGRLNRDYPGKEDVVIYDYVDTHIPVFDRMYLKRLKAYKRIGYQIASSPSPERETVHAIYDSDTYLEAYENDLLHAEKEIILSSPTLSRPKVEHMIALLRERQETGVNVVILTLHPDVYRFGRNETRLELMERLRLNGFQVELSNGWQQRYAVIDREIVWYGSMNLLSKEDVEDSIIRITDRDVAAELLEGSFRKDADTEQFTLPLTGSDSTNQ